MSTTPPEEEARAGGAESVRCARCGARLAARFAACPRCLLRGVSETAGDAEPVEVGGDAEGAEPVVPGGDLEDAEPVVLGGRFELGEPLGRGATATVFRARDRASGGEAAVKLLDLDLARDAEALARFEREVRASSMLAHPGLVRVLDHGRDGELAWLATELVPGGSLAARLPLAAADAVAVLREVCAALEHAHAAGLVHRDLKPANVLLDAEGRAKVADFGVARLVGGGAEWAVTAVGRGAGTPHYMAPEALAGAEPDPRMDVYSLGVLLYEALTGRLPMGDFDRLPGALDALVRRALAPDPARRFASAAELARALDSAEIRREVGAARERGASALPPDERGWRLAVAAVCAVATAMALWAAVRSLTPRTLAPDAVEPLTLLATEPLPDGRLVARARFETGAILAAVAAFAAALAATALLFRHWRASGLVGPGADRPLPESRRVVAVGIASCALYALRLAPPTAASGAGLLPYLPLLGGLVLLGGLLAWWVAVLEARRVERPLARERGLWLGTALVVLPPVVELARWLAAWRPS